VAESGEIDVPAWFVQMLPIKAAPGVAQISKGWQQFGTITLVSHSRFAYGALWNSAWQMMGALALAGLLGGYLGSIILRRLRAPLQAVIDQANAITERRFVTIDEPKVPELKQLATAMNATVVRLKAMFAEEAARLESVRKEANFDPLTGLANRSYFMARLHQSLDEEDAPGGSLIMIRLADLAGINRRLGRAGADDFLRRSGACIGQCGEQRPLGIAARLNGADFAVLLPGEANAKAAAEALLKALIEAAAPFVEHASVASIGAGKFSYGMEMGSVLARIDNALATAESGGGNAVREEEVDTDDELPRTAEQWSQMIHLALDRNWVRLVSFPVVDLSGRLLHRECPLRLMFDEKGEWLPAGRFLPIAERLKLTPALDLAAIALGLQELKAKPELTGLAINLSASSLEDATFHEKLIALLRTERNAAFRLWLEVAESGALKHLAMFRALCQALKTLGCHVGLEHFGRQFSRIGELHDLGLDYLKVDASFVHGIESNSGNQAFLKGLSSIAHSIGLQVFAEGVTSGAELEALTLVGFDGATGPAIKDQG
jgi:diguanylate cyclase (GGDEF)-like protein